MPGHHCGRVIHQTSRQHRSFATKRAQGSDYLLLGGCWGIQMAGSWQLNSLKRNTGWLPLSGKCWQAPSLNTVMTAHRCRQGTERFFLTDHSIQYYKMVSLFYCRSTWVDICILYADNVCTMHLCIPLLKEIVLFNDKHTYQNIPWLTDPIIATLQYYTHLKITQHVQNAWELACDCLCRIDVLSNGDAISELIFSSCSLREKCVCHVDRQLIF